MWWFAAVIQYPCGKMEGRDRGIALLEVHGPVSLKILHSQSKKTPASKRWELTEPSSYFPHTHGGTPCPGNDKSNFKKDLGKQTDYNLKDTHTEQFFCVIPITNSKVYAQ